MIKQVVMMMVACAVVLSWASVGAAESWTNVSLVDANCAAKVKDTPDTHTRACALQCQKSGFGILAGDGTFLKFDDAGNAKAVAALEASKSRDHLRVAVTGTREGATIKVESLRLQ